MRGKTGRRESKSVVEKKSTYIHATFSFSPPPLPPSISQTPTHTHTSVLRKSVQKKGNFDIRDVNPEEAADKCFIPVCVRVRERDLEEEAAVQCFI